jgi:hypothetical protein
MSVQVMTHTLPSAGRIKQAARDAKERFDVYIEACELLVRENPEALQLVRPDRRPPHGHAVAAQDCDQMATKSRPRLELEAKVCTVILDMLEAVDGTNSELLREMGLFSDDDYWALHVHSLTRAGRLLSDYRSDLQQPQRSGEC